MPEQHISEMEMRKLLREAYAQDPERGFLAQVTRGVSDPAMPRDANSTIRFHPLWLTLGLVALFVAGVFFYFSFAR